MEKLKFKILKLLLAVSILFTQINVVHLIAFAITEDPTGTELLIENEYSDKEVNIESENEIETESDQELNEGANEEVNIESENEIEVDQGLNESSDDEIDINFEEDADLVEIASSS